MKEGKHVVLYVDDDYDLLESMKLVLEAKGFVAETAASAEEGLKAFQRCRPDLIIIDLMMEEVDAGTSLIKELRLAGNTAPMYMLSSVGDQLHQSVDTSALGLSGVFQKPVNFDGLVRTIRQKLG
jgi:DNA-binding response OmpR family regulator